MDMNNYTSSIIAKITDESVTFTNEIMGEAVRRWGYDREDFEKALRELAAYRRLGNVQSCADAFRLRECIVPCGQCKSLEANAKLLEPEEGAGNDWWCHEMERSVYLLDYCGIGQRIKPE